MNKNNFKLLAKDFIWFWNLNEMMYFGLAFKIECPSRLLVEWRDFLLPNLKKMGLNILSDLLR